LQRISDANEYPQAADAVLRLLESIDLVATGQLPRRWVPMRLGIRRDEKQNAWGISIIL